MKIEEYEQRKMLALVGIENHLGKTEALKFLDGAEHDSKSELSFVDALTQETLLERVVWRLEFKLEQLNELQKRENGHH